MKHSFISYIRLSLCPLKFLAISLVAAALLNGCSYLESYSPFSSPAPQAKPANSDLSSLPEAVHESRPHVELIWRAESDADSFKIKHGTKPGELGHEIRAPRTEVDELESSQGLSVYRYIIRDVSNEDTIYLSIQTERQGILSDPALIEVAPSK